MGGGAPGGEPPPAAGGMMTPQTPNGKIEGGKVNLKLISTLATQTLASFETGTPEFKCTLDIIKSIEKLAGKQGEKSEELMPAEIKQMMQGLSGPGQMGGGAPPGGPPGGGAPPPM